MYVCVHVRLVISRAGVLLSLINGQSYAYKPLLPALD